MSHALKCDGPTCGKVATGEDSPESWFRVERQGDLELGFVPVAVPAIISLVDGDDYEDDDWSNVDVDDAAESLPSVTMHFCSYQCLAEWAQLGQAVYEAPDEPGPSL